MSLFQIILVGKHQFYSFDSACLCPTVVSLMGVNVGFILNYISPCNRAGQTLTVSLKLM